ncbi:MAG: hypothetical protein ACXAC2_11855, partial [Candidatus Kariarchaeaceae archaeon]
DSSSSINYNVDGLSKGVYNFTIVIFDQSSNSVLDEVWVTVVDSTPPSFDTVPSDYQYDEGTTGHTLTWNFTDLYEATYTIYRNGSQIDSNTWTNASDVTINIDGLTTAFYNFTIIVFDDTGNYNIDIVWVEVIDSGPPTFNSSPPNIQYEEEATGNTLTWNVNDQTPNNYTIYQWDGTTNTTVESGSWLSDVDIAINVDGLSKGVYNYSIWLYDLSGNSAYHSVLVTVVDTTPPVVDNPANMQYFEGNSGNTITWVASDNHPDKLTIYRNGSFIFSTGWTTGNIIWNIDGLEYGVYNYTILLTDKSNNQITSAVWVTVIDNTPPIIDTPDDIIYPTGSSGNEIEWIGEDFHPSYYELRRNGTVIDGSGVWVSQGTIRIDIDGLEIKIYIYNITLFDESGNTISDEVIVEVTEESVFKSVPEDYFYLIGETGNFLNWTVSDANPDKYIIYREEVSIDSGTWINNVPITYNIDGLGIGVYNFTIYANNTAGKSISHQLNVTVSDMPLFSEIPLNIPGYIEGNSGYSLTWNFTDLSPDTYTIYRNGTNIDTNTWSNENNVTINIDGLSVGVYNFTIIIFDNPGNYNTSSVWVTVLDNINPSIDEIPPNIDNYTEGQLGYTVEWKVTDLHADYYEIYRNNTVLVASDTWTTGVNITLDIDGLAKGAYNYTLIVYDTSGNSDSHTVNVLVLDETIPDITSASDDITGYIEGTSTPTLSWDAVDLYEGNYIIYQNGSNVKSGSWDNFTTTTIDISGLPKGLHNFTIIIYDVSMNYNTSIVWVTVIDATVPSLDATPSDIPDYVEGVTSDTLSWDVTDLYENTYVIYQNGSNVASNTWTNGSSITYNIDGLSKGGYNFTLVVFDASNNYNTHTVLVTVSDETNPGIDTPQSDLTDYVEGSGGNSLSWAVSDIYPTTYEIYQNLTVIIGSGSWNNGVNITVSIDGLTKGVYNFTLYVYDESGNIGSHVVWVTVIDDVDPIFVETPVDIPDYIEEVTLTSLSWNTTDLYEGTYIIYQNLTIPVGSGSWTNSSEITQPINGLSIGVYNFTIFVSDASGNTINDTVWVTVSDTTPPEGNTGNMIRWNVSDTNPAMYIVNNNSILYDSGTYNGGTVWISVDGLPIGIYTFELILNDTSGNITPHSVTVTVIETTSPTFDKIPVYREYYESDPTSYTLGWNVTDTYPGTYLVYTWDGFTNTTIDSSSWTNADNITINISGLSKGLYNYSILVYDSSFNLVSHWVYVNVTDATAPVIAAYPSDFAYESGSTGNVLSWNATDNYADKYEIYKNGTLEIFGTGSWNTPTLI